METCTVANCTVNQELSEYDPNGMGMGMGWDGAIVGTGTIQLKKKGARQRQSKRERERTNNEFFLLCARTPQHPRN